MIKYLMISAAVVMASSVNAANEWFDAGISEYADWPTDGSDREVVGAGVWKDTDSATLNLDRHALRVTTEPGKSLKFHPAVRRDAESGELTIKTTAGILSESDTLIDLDPDIKVGVAALDIPGEGVHCFGLAKDPFGTTNRWIQLSGLSPNIARDAIDFEITLKTENGHCFARYVAEGITLTNEGRSWFLLAADDSTVTSLELIGDYEVSALSAESEVAAELVDLTIPAVANIDGVTMRVAGVEIEPQDGVYRVTKNSVVTILFKPASGYALNHAQSTFLVSEAMELPAEYLPTAIDVSAVVTINEVAAKNTAFLTKGGYAEIDWVEFKNNGDTDVDLTGWHFFNNPSKKIKNWTKILGSCVVPAHGYKVLWCDGDELCPDAVYTANDEAFVRCNISTDAGKHTVFLADKEGNIIQQIKMPAGFKDVTYGYGMRERTVFGARSAAEYRVGDGGWTRVNGAVGMSSGATGFTVTTYKMNATVNKISDAEKYLKDSSKWSEEPKTQIERMIAFCENVNDTGSTIADLAFPSQTTTIPGMSGANVVIVAEGTINIPRAGSWTFAVGSDDGFALKVSNEQNSYTAEFADSRSYGQSLSAFSFPEPGSYNVRLIYFNKSGNASLDFSVAEGDWTEQDEYYLQFNADRFHLVGSDESGVLHDGALAGHIAANVSEEMKGVTDTLEWRASFDLESAPADSEVYRLRVRYADGFTAKVNGTPIASVSATEARPAAAALTAEAFDIPAASLRAGVNTIEITAVNNAVDDADFFLSPTITMTDTNGEFVYFHEPTPGAANTTAGTGPQTPTVEFSVPHGYKTEPFALELSCTSATHSAIYYTTDGTSPTVNSTLYTGPITISRTTCIRAAVPQDNAIMQTDTAATYLFLADVLKQNTTPPSGFPANKAANNHTMRYGMRSLSGDDAARAEHGFTNSIATISLVIDPKNLFDPASGIYVNPSGDGKPWERMTMVEQIDPVNGAANEFTIPAGLRIRGAASRNSNNPKHSLRLFFRSEYGAGSLKFKLFGDEGADEFEKVDLRTSQNYAWSYGNSANATFIEECFSRDSQRDMGEAYTRSRYYNLFINGVYWGLYMTQERGDEDYAETYLNGSAASFDVIKTTSPGYVTTASAGDEAAWRALYDIAARQGFAGEYANNYMRILGRNPDGGENPDYPVYLNPINLMKYMISVHFSGDTDSPASYTVHANNIYALRDRTKRDGFIFLRHDAEHSLGVRGNTYSPSYDYTFWGTEAQSTVNAPKANKLYKEYKDYNPAQLHYLLCQNEEYRLAYADQVHRYCVREGGAMTAPMAAARFRARMAEIDDAVVCESARWGSTSRTRSTWLSACNNVCIKFINERGEKMIAQYRKHGWYPRIDAPIVKDEQGTTLMDGAVMRTVRLAGAADGCKIYYTLDGSDPRLMGGAVNASALEYADGKEVKLEPGRELTIKARVRNEDGEWSALEEVRVIGEVQPTLFFVL